MMQTVTWFFKNSYSCIKSCQHFQVKCCHSNNNFFRAPSKIVKHPISQLLKKRRKKQSCGIFQLTFIQSASLAYVRSYNGLFLFSIFTFFQKDLETNDTSFESPKIELLESSMKLGMAWPWSWPYPLKWKSTPSSKTHP